MALKIADRVKETTTTTGTGTISLAGAMTGFQAFSAGLSNGDTCYYALQGVDGSGNPTSVWETGIGTYASSGNTLARTTVLSSSNSGSLVTLAGTTQVWLDVTAWQVQAMSALENTTVIGVNYSLLNPFFVPATMNTSTTSGFSVGTARLYPILVHRPMTVKPAVYVRTAGSSDTHLQLALYDSDPSTGKPNNLMHSFADMAIGTGTGFQSPTDSFAIARPGVYWSWGLHSGTTQPSLQSIYGPSSANFPGFVGLLGITSSAISSGTPAGGTYAYTFTYVLNTPPSTITQASLTDDATSLKLFWVVTNQQ